MYKQPLTGEVDLRHLPARLELLRQVVQGQVFEKECLVCEVLPNGRARVFLERTSIVLARYENPKNSAQFNFE